MIHQLMSSGILPVAIAGVFVVLMVVRRLAGQPVQGSRLVLPPLILIGVGGYQLATHAGELTGTAAVSLVVTAAVSVVFGVARAATMRLFERDGYLWQRYTGWTFLVMVGAFAARAGVRLVLPMTGGHVDTHNPGAMFSGSAGHVLMATMLLTSGLGFVGESLVIGSKVMNSGVPLAPSGRGGGSLGGLVNSAVNSRMAARDGGGADWRRGDRVGARNRRG